MTFTIGEQRRRDEKQEVAEKDHEGERWRGGGGLRETFGSLKRSGDCVPRNKLA
jgi:hypothetical protein